MNRRIEIQKRTADDRKNRRNERHVLYNQEKKDRLAEEKADEKFAKNLARKDRDTNVLRGTDQRKCDVQR